MACVQKYRQYMARLIQINQLTGLLLQADFTKILEKIDGLVELLKQESEDDKSKKTLLGQSLGSVPVVPL